MNSIHSVIAGLASSLFLTLGLERLAARFDPLVAKSDATKNLRSAAYCAVTPCNWQPQSGGLRSAAYCSVTPCNWRPQTS